MEEDIVCISATVQVSQLWFRRRRLYVYPECAASLSHPQYKCEDEDKVHYMLKKWSDTLALGI